MTTLYQHVELLSEENSEPIIIGVSKRWIEAFYWPYFQGRMEKVGLVPTMSSCIRDFCIINWAEKVTLENTI